MKKFHVAIALSLLCILALPGLAAADPVIAEVENQGDTLVFHPVTEYERLVLTVSGPCGFEYRQVATQKEQPFFRLDETTIDGMYRFEVTAVPTIAGSPW